MAELHFYHGPMSASKSAQLLMNAYDYEQSGRFVLATKPALDMREHNVIASRAGLQRTADFLVGSETNLEATVLRHHTQRPIDCLFVDESQFLEPEQVDQAFRLAVLADIAVRAYGLKTDFKTRLFPGSQRLLELAHVSTEIPGICRDDSCNDNATLNARLVDSQYVRSGDVVAIEGDNVTYESLCGPHYLQHVGLSFDI